MINPNITHSIINNTIFHKKSKNIITIPTIFLNNKKFNNNHITIQNILSKLNNTTNTSKFKNKKPYNILIINNNPTNNNTTIYTTHKNLHTNIITDHINNQINNTTNIKNFITIKKTTNSKFSSNLTTHIDQYNINTITNIHTTNIKKTNKTIKITLKNNTILKNKTIIITTNTN